MQTAPVTLFALRGVPLIEPGDDLAAILAAAVRDNGVGLQDSDILVVAQKIVSKAEGRYVDLEAVVPSEEAKALAQRSGKDPRHVETILSESDDIVKVGPHLIIAAHKLGFVMANAGIDESNISHGEGAGRLLLLPCDPDGSAASIKAALDADFDVAIGVIINDSFGRPWRNGVVGIAIGSAGVPSLVDLVGSSDLFGRELRVTEVAIADELASAASLLMGQAGAGLPAVIVRGFQASAPERSASVLVRDKERDLFR
ncbi:MULTISPECIES: coenzyme F420-0:L-glutamate ligase [unclassified Hyphomicrobium]|uniref:coenzyme F420-0:L-glutamate ligase n=1 Tax=unclassified Hyphomicrobium TaxID=2619925 RepID=UPI000213F4A6|nr:MULTISPECIES: coenzyme F420-0:L-glutamate ligase [unclassified Hyphomicrobium]CCB66760.1 F420-0:gamma-glutamyl ligase [Hyphomicrobium sp. MC1]